MQSTGSCVSRSHVIRRLVNSGDIGRLSCKPPAPWRSKRPHGLSVIHYICQPSTIRPVGPSFHGVFYVPATIDLSNTRRTIAMAAMARPDALKHKRQREVSASVQPRLDDISISYGMTWLLFGVAIEFHQKFSESNIVLRPSLAVGVNLKKRSWLSEMVGHWR
jgi:hypothetical protein